MYVDAFIDRQRDRIHIVERDKNQQRQYQEHQAKYIMYYDDPKGKFKSIYGNPVSRIQCRSNKDFRREKALHVNVKTYESDMNPVFRCLEENYLGQNAPKLQIAFFDIEVDFDINKGFSPPEDPFNPVTAISIYLQWAEQLITLLTPPRGMSKEEVEKISSKFENTFVFEEEADLLKTFLDVIEDADVLSGWNSEGYDIPYMVNRVKRVLSKDDTRRFCLFGQFPKERRFERFGKEQQTFDLIGRVHMDYMQLYRKYTYHEMHSYSLDAISEYELGEHKVQYTGTLDQLFNNDWEKFIEYSRQDTMLLHRLDEKLRFADLSNELAHSNTVLIQTTMGAVAVTEQAIINEAHEQGFVVPDRRKHEGNTAAAGAYVAYPKKGLHDWIGAIDINSLYPSAIRALNMDPATIVGQLRPDYNDAHVNEAMGNKKSFAEAWEGKFGSTEYQMVMDQDKVDEIVVEWENMPNEILTGAEIYNKIFLNGNKWVLSANGTIFTHETKGIIPGLLERWYKERQDIQKVKLAAKSPEEKAFWDKRQLVKKINLNSLYGAILNPGCRFFDKRIGQSTTLTGRTIAKFMSAKVNEIITGEFDHRGDSIIYGDTDSVYFSAWPVVKDAVEKKEMEWDKDICVKLYDNISEQINEEFPKHMKEAFNCPRANGEIIQGGREIVAIKGLYITKKRYACLIYDLEGSRLDRNGPGKVKAMGLDLKRSDTPKIIQDFLSDILLGVLTGDERVVVIDKIRNFKQDFKHRPAWEKGSPKRCNNLTKFTEAERREGKTNMPGHVRASMNWNTLCRMNHDKYSEAIMDGQKVIVCKLKPNPLGFVSVAYPTDQLHLPQWFKELPFNDAEMENTVISNKVENLLGVLKWDLVSDTDTSTTFDSLFDFE
jgi:DNA polymerase elongation subunit (family B)